MNKMVLGAAATVIGLLGGYFVTSAIINKKKDPEDIVELQWDKAVEKFNAEAEKLQKGLDKFDAAFREAISKSSKNKKEENVGNNVKDTEDTSVDNAADTDTTDKVECEQINESTSTTTSEKEEVSAIEE